VTDDQAASTEEVASMVDQVTEAARQVSDESDNVSAAAEEQTSSMTEVARHAETLADEADDLQRELARFTIESGAGSEQTPGNGEPEASASSVRPSDGGPEARGANGSGESVSFTGGDDPTALDPDSLSTTHD
jgi:methyl-accepting chemotaxis protein